MAPGHLPYHFLCPINTAFLTFVEMARDLQEPHDIYHTHTVALPKRVLTVMFMDPQVCQALCHTITNT